MRMKVLLDLDNTLISTIPIEDMKWDETTKKRSVKFTFHNMENYYIVFERPGVQDFLDYLFANFDVSVWSAASKDYVLFIIDNVILTKPERHLEYIFFSYHCDLSKKLCDKGIKNLELIWDIFQIEGFNRNNTVIIDDLPKVKKINPHNCIAVYPFEFEEEESPNDTELEKVKEKLETLKLSYEKGELTDKPI